MVPGIGVRVQDWEADWLVAGFWRSVSALCSFRGFRFLGASVIQGSGYCIGFQDWGLGNRVTVRLEERLKSCRAEV